MNGTQQQSDTTITGQTTSGDDPTASSERRPKPIRGVGFGDIFALNGGIVNSSSSSSSSPSIKRDPKPLPSSGTISTNSTTSVAELTERLNSTSTGSTNNTLQKQIPKKPPPPAPVSRTDQAPALPPKPGAQFSSPIFQHNQQPIRPLAQHHQAKWGGTQQQQQQVREQAEVIYAYEPTNDDELAMEVGDIIDVLDKDIEDAGWWKGELRGKIGVFPDNFVKLIEKKTTSSLIQEQQLSASNSASSLNQTPTTTPNNLFNTHHHNIINNDINNKINNKPVFAATPKDFGKELENNLQRNIHNSNNTAAALLSFKRNKLQQFASMHLATENGREIPPLEHSASLTPSANIGKLNHITANRAKGPTRRPPSNLLNKRIQSLDQIQPSVASVTPLKKESTTKKQPSELTQSPIPIATPQAPLPALPVHPKVANIPLEPIVGLPAVAEALPKMLPQVAEFKRELDGASARLMSKQKSDELPDAKDRHLQAATNETLINNFNSQLNELRGEVKQIKQELSGLADLKDAMEVMKAELKACQKVSEAQGKYIKDLIKNLTEERKRFASMQEEIDRTLK